MDRGLPDPVEGDAAEGASFRGVMHPSPRTPAAIALAALAVLAVALLTRQADPGPSVATTEATPGPSTATAVASPEEPTAAPSPALSSWPPDLDPTVTPRPTFLAVPAEAGATRLLPAGATSVRLAIALPDGWEQASDAMYVKSGGAPPAGMSISAWRLQSVNIVPCRWSAREFADPALMRTAEGQAEALSAWWGQDPNMLPYWNSKIAPLASERQQTTIQHYPAWYLGVLVPSDLDFTECDGGQLILWNATNGDVRYSLGPGELNRLWIVDVDGELIVIDAGSYITTSSGNVAELQTIIDSIVIEP